MKNDNKDSSSSSSGSKSGWNDLVFGAIEKLAQASEKIKESNAPVSAAFDVFKNLKEELQARIIKDFSDRLKQMDFDSMAKKSAEHLAENFEMEIKVRFKPKAKKSNATSEAEVEAEE